MTTDLKIGCAHAVIETPVAPEIAFDALTRSDQLAAWLGTPAAPLRDGRATRIDFGDGDFFALDRVEIARPRRVSFVWRFLGVGGENRITWTVSRRATHTEVSVTDEQPDRSDHEVEVLCAGWRDFFGRLARFLATGETARYDWRRDIDGGIELARGADQAAARLLAAEALDRWLPWRADAWTDAHVTAADGGDPAALEVVDLALGTAGLRFAITAAGWRRATHGSVVVEPRRAGAMLTVSHTGWEAIDDRDAVRRRQRERFCRLWITSLVRAHALVGGP